MAAGRGDRPATHRRRAGHAGDDTGHARLHLRGRWPRHARSHLRRLFPSLPKQPGYDKRLRKAADLLRHVIRLLATDTSVWGEDVWIVDSTTVECGRSRATVKHSDLAGWAEYGCRASHSRFFWSLRLHLVCTLQKLPVAFAPTGAKSDERETLRDLLSAEPGLVAARTAQTLIGDKNYFGGASKGKWPSRTSGSCGRLAQASRSGARSAPVQALATDHRVGQRDLRGTGRSRTAPRSHARRCRRPRHATNPRGDRRDPAQRPHGRARPALTDRLWPQTPGKRSSSYGRQGRAGWRWFSAGGRSSMLPSPTGRSPRVVQATDVFRPGHTQAGDTPIRRRGKEPASWSHFHDP